MKTQKTIPACALALSFLLNGCGGGEDGFAQISRGVPRENVLTLPADGSVTFSNVTATGLTLEGTSPAIAAIRPGIVVVSAHGEGLAAKVKSVTTTGSRTTLETEPALITDIFSELEIHQRRSLNSVDIASVVTAPGVTFLGRSRDDGTITLQLSNVRPVPGSGSEVDLTGQLKLQGSLDMDLQLDNIGVRLLRFVPTLTQKLVVETKWKKTVGTPIYGHQVPLGEFTGTPIIIPVGGVPLIIVPKFKLYVKLVGRIEGGIKTAMSGSVTETLGIKYDQASGITTVSDFSATGSIDPVSVFGTVSGSIGPGADIKFLLYGLVGPTISVAAPEFEVKLSTTHTPPTINLKTNILAEGFVKLEATVFGLNLGTYDGGALIQKRWPLSDRTYLPGDARIGVQ